MPKGRQSGAEADLPPTMSPVATATGSTPGRNEATPHSTQPRLVGVNKQHAAQVEQDKASAGGGLAWALRSDCGGDERQAGEQQNVGGVPA